jgi:hypothetical protein
LIGGDGEDGRDLGGVAEVDGLCAEDGEGAHVDCG